MNNYIVKIEFAHGMGVREKAAMMSESTRCVVTLTR